MSAGLASEDDPTAGLDEIEGRLAKRDAAWAERCPTPAQAGWLVGQAKATAASRAEAADARERLRRLADAAEEMRLAYNRCLARLPGDAALREMRWAIGHLAVTREAMLDRDIAILVPARDEAP